MEQFTGLNFYGFQEYRKSFPVNIWLYTVDGERFAGLNIHGFSAIKVFVEIFSHFLGHRYSLFSINKERHLYSRKNFCGIPETMKNAKV